MLQSGREERKEAQQKSCCGSFSMPGHIHTWVHYLNPLQIAFEDAQNGRAFHECQFTIITGQSIFD